MLARLEAVWHRWRRWFSRTEWTLRLLGSARSKGTGASPGLIMIQVDGLAFKQFQRALQEGNLPFLQGLMQRQSYQSHSFYSGLPSATPGVQGELFYGIKGCVPSFSFLDKQSSRVYKMYNTCDVGKVEFQLTGQEEALLKDGSAYADIFSGGAQECHFCGVHRGWAGLFCIHQPHLLPVLFLLYADVVARVLALLIGEGANAFYEAFRGARKGQSLWEELKFIAIRLGVCIFMRELIVAGVQLDAARGLPMIHLNFFGYDEQSHRRGPSSSFAHRALPGIDRAIAKIWHAARQSDRRNYDVWIYSDHGQEDTLPYSAEHGKSIQQALNQVLQKEFPADPDLKALVTGMGPIQHVYPSRPLAEEERERLAISLIESAGIPMVLSVGTTGVAAWTDTGTFHLPEDAAQVLGAKHPFLEEAAVDLVQLCHHPNAGSLLLLGWRQGRPAKTFPLENGSHAGPGFEETHGFALLPLDTPLELSHRSYLRALDLRAAALRFLGRLPFSSAGPRTSVQNLPTLRIMTYNVHSCLGMDGKLSPERIARVIARHRPDAVALQELDIHRSRTGGIDQVDQIAQKLRMTFHFHASFRLADEQYGNAILSRFPMRLVHAAGLPRLDRLHSSEPRGALWVELDVEGASLHLINTHLSLWAAERLPQMEALLGPTWVGNSQALGPMVVCGDFNATPGSVVYHRISDKFRDAQLALKDHVPLGTWFTRRPFTRLDHIFVGPGLEVLQVAVPNTELDRVSSDHLPLLAELRIVVRRPVSPIDPSSFHRVIRPTEKT